MKRLVILMFAICLIGFWGATEAQAQCYGGGGHYGGGHYGGHHGVYYGGPARIHTGYGHYYSRRPVYRPHYGHGHQPYYGGHYPRQYRGYGYRPGGYVGYGSGYYGSGWSFGVRF